MVSRKDVAIFKVNTECNGSFTQVIQWAACFIFLFPPDLKFRSYVPFLTCAL